MHWFTNVLWLVQLNLNIWNLENNVHWMISYRIVLLQFKRNSHTNYSSWNCVYLITSWVLLTVHALQWYMHNSNIDIALQTCKRAFWSFTKPILLNIIWMQFLSLEKVILYKIQLLSGCVIGVVVLVVWHTLRTNAHASRTSGSTSWLPERFCHSEISVFRQLRTS